MKFWEKIKAKNYLISANGKTHGHPSMLPFTSLTNLLAIDSDVLWHLHKSGKVWTPYKYERKTAKGDFKVQFHGAKWTRGDEEPKDHYLQFKWSQEPAKCENTMDQKLSKKEEKEDKDEDKQKNSKKKKKEKEEEEENLKKKMKMNEYEENPKKKKIMMTNEDEEYLKKKKKTNEDEENLKKKKQNKYKN
jgi:hypothetical protein